jgi:hypothetical protein
MLTKNQRLVRCLGGLYLLIAAISVKRLVCSSSVARQSSQYSLPGSISFPHFRQTGTSFTTGLFELSGIFG